MGSNYCGEQNQSGGSTSRKGKKNGSADKPKQPQRGLGVAQLEKIRLHSQMGRGYISPNSLQSPYPVTNYPIQVCLISTLIFMCFCVFVFSNYLINSGGFGWC